jgi:multiple sugar transport system substrate-binding protein
MRLRRRSLTGLLLATPFTAGGVRSASAQDNQAGDQALSYFQEAKINWRQAEGKSLTIAMNKHPFTESLLPLLPEFKSLTGISVDYLILPEDQYNTRVAADLSTRQGQFSVFMTGPMRNWGYVSGDWILPLDDFLANPKVTDPAWYKLEDFYSGLIAANRWDGKVGGGVGQGSLYSIPVMEESYILAYRKDIFERYHIEVPTTYEAMAEAAQMVKKNAGIAGIVARGTPTSATLGTGFISGLKSYTNDQWSELNDKLKADLDDPRSVKYTEIWTDMIRESGPPNWASMQWYDAMDAFAAGQAGMIADCDFFAAGYEDPSKSKIASKVGYAMLPPGSDGKTYSGIWTWALGINKAAKSQEAAWLFVQWATSPRTLLQATVSNRNYNPTRRSIKMDARVQKTMGAWDEGGYVRTVEKNLETARVAWVPEPVLPRVGDIWARALQAIYFKRMSAPDALKHASLDIDQVFQQVGITAQ